jgi:hypothetical protein
MLFGVLEIEARGEGCSHAQLNPVTEITASTWMFLPSNRRCLPISRGGKHKYIVRTNGVGSEECSTDKKNKKKKRTPWSESTNELYRPSDRRLSAK